MIGLDLCLANYEQLSGRLQEARPRRGVTPPIEPLAGTSSDVTRALQKTVKSDTLADIPSPAET
jgi:hypothetical protein